MNRRPMKCEENLFHQRQQFEAVIAAQEARELAIYEQMRRSIEAALEEVVPPPPLPEQVTLQLHMHANELRYFAPHVQELGTNVSFELALIHDETDCMLSIADIGDPHAFNHLRVAGRIDRVLESMDRFLACIPYHCGIHLNRSKNFMSGEEYQQHCKEILEQARSTEPNVVVHFAKETPKNEDENEEKCAFFCAKRENGHVLKNVAERFAHRIAPKVGPPPIHHFWIAYMLPPQEKPWFLSESGPNGRRPLLMEISHRTSTTVRHPQNPRPEEALQMHLFGSPQALMDAYDLMRSVAQITLQFEVEDASLDKPFGHHVFIANAADDFHLVSMSVEPSPFQVHAPIGSSRIYHKITLKTSYRNRLALFAKRRSMLKHDGEISIPLNEIGKRPNKLLFADYLHDVLRLMQRPPTRGIQGGNSRKHWGR